MAPSLVVRLGAFAIAVSAVASGVRVGVVPDPAINYGDGPDLPPDEHVLPSRVKSHSLLHAARMDSADAVGDTNAAREATLSEFAHAGSALESARRAEADGARSEANRGMVKVFLKDSERNAASAVSTNPWREKRFEGGVDDGAGEDAGAKVALRESSIAGGERDKSETDAAVAQHAFEKHTRDAERLDFDAREHEAAAEEARMHAVTGKRELDEEKQIAKVRSRVAKREKEEAKELERRASHDERKAEQLRGARATEDERLAEGDASEIETLTERKETLESQLKTERAALAKAKAQVRLAESREHDAEDDERRADRKLGEDRASLEDADARARSATIASASLAAEASADGHATSVLTNRAGDTYLTISEAEKALGIARSELADEQSGESKAESDLGLAEWQIGMWGTREREASVEADAAARRAADTHARVAGDEAADQKATAAYAHQEHVVAGFAREGSQVRAQAGSQGSQGSQQTEEILGKEQQVHMAAEDAEARRESAAMAKQSADAQLRHDRDAAGAADAKYRRAADTRSSLKSRIEEAEIRKTDAARRLRTHKSRITVLRTRISDLEKRIADLKASANEDGSVGSGKHRDSMMASKEATSVHAESQAAALEKTQFETRVHRDQTDEKEAKEKEQRARLSLEEAKDGVKAHMENIDRLSDQIKDVAGKVRDAVGRKKKEIKDLNRAKLEGAKSLAQAKAEREIAAQDEKDAARTQPDDEGTDDAKPSEAAGLEDDAVRLSGIAEARRIEASRDASLAEGDLLRHRAALEKTKLLGDEAKTEASRAALLERNAQKRMDASVKVSIKENKESADAGRKIAESEADKDAAMARESEAEHDRTQAVIEAGQAKHDAERAHLDAEEAERRIADRKKHLTAMRAEFAAAHHEELRARAQVRSKLARQDE